MRIKTTIEIDYFVLNTDVINVSHKELHLQSVLAYLWIRTFNRKGLFIDFVVIPIQQEYIIITFHFIPLSILNIHILYYLIRF